MRIRRHARHCSPLTPAVERDARETQHLLRLRKPFKHTISVRQKMSAKVR